MEQQATTQGSAPAPVANILAYARPAGESAGEAKTTTGGADEPSPPQGSAIPGAPPPIGAGKPSQARAVWRALAVGLVVVLLIVVAAYAFVSAPLAKALAKKGWVVYFRQGCGYCTRQQQILGYRFDRIIECDQNGKQLGGYTLTPPLPCGSPLIKGYPFWYNTQTLQSKIGLQDLSSLESMAKWR